MLRQWCAVAFSFLLFSPALIRAQSQNSGINGTVTDPSGASVPGAEVTQRPLTPDDGQDDVRP